MDAKLIEREWKRLKKSLSSKNWDAGQEATYFGFFCHGWYGRLNEAAYQAENNSAADNKLKSDNLRGGVMKIFKLNDCDWYATEDMESAIQQIMHDTDNTREDCVDSSAHELTDDEMDRLQFIDDRENYPMYGDEAAEDGLRSAREQLALMIERGDSFPCLFATMEF